MPEINTSDRDTYYYHKSVNKTKSQCTHHYHNSFEIYYLKNGNCNYFIDNRLYELKAGDIVLIPSGVIHKTNYNETEPHTRMLINCAEIFIPTSVIPIIPSMIYLYRNPEIAIEAETVLDKIEAEYDRDDDFRSEALRCLTFELFFLLARNAKKCEIVSAGSLFIEETVKHIQKNYMNEITLSDMAKYHSVSPEHLSRTFKKETGFGFAEFLTLVRLQKAEYMLKNEPGKTVCEVAYACGFNDSNYFSDKFKRAYGQAPSKFKKKIAPKA